MNIAISAETAIDIDRNLLEKYRITTIPFSVALGNECYDDGQITAQQIFDYVKKTKKLPKTGAVNPQNYYEYFENLLKNSDAVIHFTLSSEVSSTYANACKAASQLKNVFIVDTQTLSTGIALQAIYARELTQKNYTPEQIVEKCQNRANSMHVGALLSDIDYMYKGGRCNALELFGANLLRLRVQIVMKNGKMTPCKKYRGRIDGCLQKYLNDVLDDYKTPDLSRVFVTRTSATDEQIEFARNLLEERGFKEIYVAQAGAAVTTHCGENCFGIMFFTDGGNPDLAK